MSGHAKHRRATDHYAHHPLVITACSANDRVLRHYVLVGAPGDVPKGVVAAAARRRPQDEALLRGYYGAQWRVALEPRPPPGAPAGEHVPSDDLAQVHGGADSDGLVRVHGGADSDDLVGLFAELDAPPETTSEATQEATPKATPGATPGATPEGAPGVESMETLMQGPTTYVDLSVYADDTMEDIQTLVHIATGLPPWRQYISFITDSGAAGRPHRVSVDGMPISTNLAEALADTAADRVAGAPVDRTLEQRREALRIDADGPFIGVEVQPGVFIRRVFVTDLFAVVRPEIVARLDNYEFDLLYYGFVLRFWPRLASREAARLAFADPGRLAAEAPRLGRETAAAARAQRTATAAFARAAHALYAGRDADDHPSSVVEATLDIPVVATATIAAAAAVAAKPGVPLDITTLVNTSVNLSVADVFDRLAAGPSVPAALIRYNRTTELGAVVPTEFVKRSQISYQQRPAEALEWLLAHRPTTKRHVSMLLAAPGCTNDLAYGLVLDNGRVQARATWPEDRAVDFARAADTLRQALSPVMQTIDMLGAVAQPRGRVVGNDADGVLAHITVVFTWTPPDGHMLSSAEFQLLKAALRRMERAGCAAPRATASASSSNAYAMTFRRGATPGRRAPAGALAAYDRAAAVDGAPLNRYRYLVDDALWARWQMVCGRAVVVRHRITDVRFGIDASDADELRLIRAYVNAALAELTLAARQPRASDAPRSQRLRRLQEIDPVLFDLRRHDANATVYSVLCQSDRQPIIYTEQEIASLPARRRDALVQYWNYTRNEPAYYECPSPQYPHLSFRAGVHARGYCVPCCKKTLPVKGSRAETTNDACVAAALSEAPTAVPSFTTISASRHVLASGKAVPVGRLGDLPPSTERLLHAAARAPHRLLREGVTQHLGIYPRCGTLFAIAGAVETKAQEILDTLPNVIEYTEIDRARVYVERVAAAIRRLGPQFAALGGGQAGLAFGDAEACARALEAILATERQQLSEFAPGGLAEHAMLPIVSDATWHAYGVHVTVIRPAVSTLASERDLLEMSVGAAEALRSGDPNAQYALLLSDDTGIYPVVLTNNKRYVKSPAELRPLLARRVFTLRQTYDIADGVVELLRESLANGAASAQATSLPTAAEFLAAAGSKKKKQATHGFTVKAQFTNFANGQVYAVLLELPDAQCAVLPVSQSHPLAACPVADESAATYARVHATMAATLACIAEYNNAAKIAMQPVARVLSATSTIGVAFATPTGLAYALWQDAPLTANTADGVMPVSVVRALYDPARIDAAVGAWATGRRAPLLSARAEKLMHASQNEYKLARLFMAEFGAALASARNTPAAKRRRGPLRAAVESAFAVSAPATRKRRTAAAAVAEALADRGVSLRDRTRLAAAASVFVRLSSNTKDATRRAYLRAFDETTFEFDLVAIGIDLEARAVESVRALMSTHVKVVDEPTPAAVGSAFVACALDSSQPQCAHAQLVVPRARFDDLVSVAAARLVARPDEALSLPTGGSFRHDFVERPGERIYQI